jgi:hypothetical protein
MVGLRLHSPARSLRGYADALVGVGHYDGQPVGSANATQASQASATHMALSFGLGLRLLPTRVGSLFADAHYDIYIAGGAPSQVIPIKLGFALP